MYFSIGRVFNLLMVVMGLLRFLMKVLDMCYSTMWQVKRIGMYYLL